MAEIRIERKSPSIWPWVAGVAALIAIVALWAWNRNGPDQLATGTPLEQSAQPRAIGTGGDAGLPSEVRDFASFVHEPPVEQGPAHEYAADGIRSLTAALSAISNRNPQFEQQFNTFRQKADGIQEDAESLDHANEVRAVFVEAAGLMSQVQQARALGAGDLRERIDQTRDAAESVRGDRPLLEQQRQVKTFFDRAAEAVTMLARDTHS